MRHKGFSLATLLVLASMILAACGGGGTSQAPTAAPAPAAEAPTAAPAAAAPTAAPAAAEPTAAPAAGEAPTAAPAGEAGSTIVVPQGLRTDLKGASIKWIGGADAKGSSASQEFTAVDITAAEFLEEVADLTITVGHCSTPFTESCAAHIAALWHPLTLPVFGRALARQLPEFL